MVYEFLSKMTLYRIFNLLYLNLCDVSTGDLQLKKVDTQTLISDLVLPSKCSSCFVGTFVTVFGEEILGLGTVKRFENIPLASVVVFSRWSFQGSKLDWKGVWSGSLRE